VPQRTCIACRRVGDKRQLIRVVRTPTTGVRIDPSGKLNGRGAYLCQARPCWEKALRSGLLARALKTTIAEDDLAALQAFAASLPASPEDAPEPLARPEVESSD
jgi:predicted RNA-binding protein YlxR (DUF448 family)